MASDTSSAGLEAAVARLRTAVFNAGPRPDIHLQVMARHRSEWPTLWAAIDEVLRLWPSRP